MNPVRVVIVDDERIMAEELKIMLTESYPEVELVGMCHDGEAALKLIRKLRPELVFLDIEMPGMNGLEVAKCLMGQAHAPFIVFVTAFDEFALKAFAVNAVDYILKPLDERDVERVMSKAEKLLAGRSTATQGTKPVSKPGTVKKFSVEKGDRMEIVDSDNVRLIYAKDRQVFLATNNGETYRAKLTLQDFELRLPPEKFFRCHRNYIVNIDEIKQIATWFKKGYLLILKGTDNLEVPVGRAYAGKMKEYIEL